MSIDMVTSCSETGDIKQRYCTQKCNKKDEKEFIEKRNTLCLTCIIIDFTRQGTDTEKTLKVFVLNRLLFLEIV